MIMNMTKRKYADLLSERTFLLYALMRAETDKQSDEYESAIDTLEDELMAHGWPYSVADDFNDE